MPKSAVIGDSHANAAVRAKAGGKWPNIDAVDIRYVDDKFSKSKEISETLISSLTGKEVFFCLGGTEYNLIGLIEADAPFDFVMSGFTTDSSRDIIATSVVKSLLYKRMRGTLARTEKLLAALKSDATYFAAPPPFRSVSDTTVFPTAFKPLLEKGIAPALVRMKLYLLQNNIMRQFCSERGLRFLSPPHAALDADGFLRDECWSKDPTHGNALYGNFLLEEISGIVHD